MELHIKLDQPICRSMFRSGAYTTREAVTQKWIELIRQLERDKENRCAITDDHQ